MEVKFFACSDFPR